MLARELVLLSVGALAGAARVQLDALIARWNAHSVTSGSVRVTGDDLAGIVQSLTLDDSGAALVPSLVTRLARGDLGASHASSHEAAPRASMRRACAASPRLRSCWTRSA